MKTILALAAALFSFGAIAPATAQAHESCETSRVSYTCGCGAPVYQVRYIVGYRRDGCAIYSWRTVSHTCRPSHRGHDHGRGHSDRHDHGGRGHGHRR